MSESLFATLLIILALLYGFKKQITKFINVILLQDKTNTTFKSVYLSFTLFILMFVVLIYGMLYGTKVKTKFSNVSQGFEKIKPKNSDRPNPLFDIDTYW